MNSIRPSAPRVRPIIKDRSDLFLIDEFLDPLDCRQWIATAEASGFERALINTSVGQLPAPEVRNNDRLIWDDPELAERWWQRAAALIPAAFGRWHASGLNERFRFYRYRPGQRFAAHYDGSYQRNRDENSWLTLLVYLNDDFAGGTTRFDLAGVADPVVVQPQAGMALVFMHDRLHQGDEVTAGTKYVLRTDVMYRHERAQSTDL